MCTSSPGQFHWALRALTHGCWSCAGAGFPPTPNRRGWTGSRSSTRLSWTTTRGTDRPQIRSSRQARPALATWGRAYCKGDPVTRVQIVHLRGAGDEPRPPRACFTVHCNHTGQAWTWRGECMHLMLIHLGRYLILFGFLFDLLCLCLLPSEYFCLSLFMFFLFCFSMAISCFSRCWQYYLVTFSCYGETSLVAYIFFLYIRICKFVSMWIVFLYHLTLKFNKFV